MELAEEQEQSMKLEDLQPRASVRGVLANSPVTVVSVQWFGSEALELTYKTPAGRVANELLYRNDEPRLEIVEVGRPWSFDGDGALFRLVSEAQRIHLAHLFSFRSVLRTRSHTGSRKPRPTCTKPSPTTFAKSSTVRRRSRTIGAPAPWASR